MTRRIVPPTRRGRRDVLAGGGAAVAAIALPFAARAQQSATPPVVGFLRSIGTADSDDQVAAFRRGLGEAGFVEGRNVVIEFRSAENRAERLPGLAAELVDRQVAVIVGNAVAALAAKAATATIPIVFVSGEDPIRLGLVASLARPGGNVTGVAFLDRDLTAKRLGLLHELTPRLATIAVLADPAAPGSDTELKSVEDASRAIGRRILIVKATDDAEIDVAFETAVRANAQAMFVGSGPFYGNRRGRLAALAARHGLPAIYPLRSFAEAGGLMSYGPSLPDAYRRAGGYVGRILKGAKPADLPVELPTRFELVINLRTAKALGLEIPPLLLTTADEVIE